jgi:5-methylthioribose kinase
MDLPDEQRAALDEALDRMGLSAPRQRRQMTALVGGVSSWIVRVESDEPALCLKRALPQLRVSAVWYAPVERNEAEVAWLRLVSAIESHWVPRVLGQDRVSQSFAMQYLPEADHPVWKRQLRDGHVDPLTAAAVGDRLGRIHAATSNRADLAQQFANQDQFYALRLEPYFVECSTRHPSLAPALTALVERTHRMSLALVHGDVSPKNILVGPNGPVFLDAECAVYGDPAFDLAFCLNHLLLKSVWRPQHRDELFRSFTRLTEAYVQHLSWEPLEQFYGRVAELLAALLLARVDGKSPVEYITDPQEQDRVRGFATSHLAAPSASPLDLLFDWSKDACPMS